MTRLAIIGNSHVGALKQGWDSIRAEHADVAVDFFAAPGRYFRLLQLGADGRLAFPETETRDGTSVDVIRTINGRTDIDLSRADAVLWVGYEWGWRELVELVSRFDIDGLRRVGGQGLMSRAAFDSIAAALAEGCVPPLPWRDSRPGHRLFVLPRPAPAESSLSSKRAVFRAWNRVHARPDGALACFGIGVDHLEQALRGVGIGMFRQPTTTLLPSGVTADRHSRGARRMLNGKDFPDNDFGHMNPQFGALCLQHILPNLKAPLAQSV